MRNEHWKTILDLHSDWIKKHNQSTGGIHFIHDSSPLQSQAIRLYMGSIDWSAEQLFHKPPHEETTGYILMSNNQLYCCN